MRRSVVELRATVVAVVVAVLLAAALYSGSTASAGARTPAVIASRSCSSYPRPGTTSAAAVPSDVGTEYGVLRHRRRGADEVPLRRLGSLPESGILVRAVRYLGRVPYGGRAYMVPSLHLLASPLAPPRCVPPSQRALQRALLPSLRKEYPHHGLCLVIIYRVRATPACESAPGSVDALLYGPGIPGLGIVPDAVPAVRLSFRKHTPVRALVHNNFWVVKNSELQAAPCGLQWISRDGAVLRTVASCTASSAD